MRKTKTIKIDDKEITCRELTVSDIKEMMDAVSGKQNEGINTIDLLFGDELPGEAIEKSCGITVADLEKNYAPSELNQIIEAVKEVNPFLLAMFAKLTKAVNGLTLPK